MGLLNWQLVTTYLKKDYAPFPFLSPSVSLSQQEASARVTPATSVALRTDAALPRSWLPAPAPLHTAPPPSADAARSSSPSAARLWRARRLHSRGRGPRDHRRLRETTVCARPPLPPPRAPSALPPANPPARRTVCEETAGADCDRRTSPFVRPAPPSACPVVRPARARRFHCRRHPTLLPLHTNAAGFKADRPATLRAAASPPPCEPAAVAALHVLPRCRSAKFLKPCVDQLRVQGPLCCPAHAAEPACSLALNRVDSSCGSLRCSLRARGPCHHLLRSKNFKDRVPPILFYLRCYSSKCMMCSQCTWDGTLSPEDFRIAARSFSERWRHINPAFPQWMWISQPMSSISTIREEEGYLSLENIYHPRSSDYIASECYPGSGEENDDCATLVQNDNQETLIYDYHIVYSFSFKVPVLYFRGYRYDGQRLRSDEIQKDLPPHSLSILEESKWTYMTQEDHPFLHRPWYMLHPCGTRDWMKLLFSRSLAIESDVAQQYLPSWLSVVGQAVGLRIPLEMQNRSFTSSLLTRS